MNEKRQFLRVPVERVAFVEVESQGLGENKAGRVVACKSLDVSRAGLQMVLDEEAILGAILQIGVATPGTKETLCLVGTVRWCLPNDEEPGTWLCGFQLMNAHQTDIKIWIDMINDLEL